MTLLSRHTDRLPAPAAPPRSAPINARLEIAWRIATEALPSSLLPPTTDTSTTIPTATLRWTIDILTDADWSARADLLTDPSTPITTLEQLDARTAGPLTWLTDSRANLTHIEIPRVARLTLRRSNPHPHPLYVRANLLSNHLHLRGGRYDLLHTTLHPLPTS